MDDETTQDLLIVSEMDDFFELFKPTLDELDGLVKKATEASPSYVDDYGNALIIMSMDNPDSIRGQKFSNCIIKLLDVVPAQDLIEVLRHCETVTGYMTDDEHGF